MRIKTAHVTNYRSVVDSTEFDIEPHKTILVGINEAGKTALLKALQQINAPDGTPPMDMLADYPRYMLNDLLTGKVEVADVEVVAVKFDLDPHDLAVLPTELGVTGDVVFEVFRYLNNTYKYRLTGVAEIPKFKAVRQDLVRIRAHVSKQADGAEEIVAKVDRALAHQDSDSIQDTVATELQALATDLLPLVDEDDEKEMERWARIGAASKVSSLRCEAWTALKGSRSWFITRPTSRFGQESI